MVGARLKYCALVAGLVTFSSAAFAAPDLDPCAPSVAAPPAPGSLPRYRLDHDSATMIVRHVQRACLAAAKLSTADFAPAIAKAAIVELALRKRKLRLDVLEPIYSAYPELRGKDLSGPDADEPKAIGKPPPGRIGAATAYALRWVLAKSARLPANLFEKSAKAADTDRALLFLMDYGAEIAMAGSPVYAAFPGLQSIAMEEAEAIGGFRTAKSDAEFRMHSPPRGSVTLSAAAIASIRDFLASAQHLSGRRDEVAVLSWILSTRFRRSGEIEWTTTGPGVELGGFTRRQVPPDVIQEIDGLPIMFESGQAGRFEGKLIDYVDKKFLLRER